jgi:hypothetical protein
LGDPASSYVTAGIALEMIGARKPHRHDKAETPPGGIFSISNLNISYLPKLNELADASQYKI